MVAIKGKKSSNKNPPILSHEFVIQNHADIVSCVAMVFVIGLMVQATSPWAYIFIALHHNVSSMNSSEGTALPTPASYTVGWKDACAVFFYFLITIVMHAVVQEYIFDKISKKQKLSKTKLSKFNESCQLILFYLLSTVWGVDIILREKMFLNISKLWTEYPAPMSFSLKFFFVAQIAYWLHSYPELYFQRVKKEDIMSRVFQATIGLVFVVGAYVLNFQQVGVCLLVLHYAVEGLYHSARLIHFLNYKENVSKIAFSISNIGFLAARLATVALSALVFFYGLGQVESSLDVSTGNFNIPAIRYPALAAIVLFQVYMSYLVLKKVSSYVKSKDTPTSTKVKVQKPKKKREASKKSEKSGGSEEDESSGENAIRKSLRLRNTPKTK